MLMQHNSSWTTWSMCSGHWDVAFSSHGQLLAADNTDSRHAVLTHNMTVNLCHYFAKTLLTQHSMARHC